MANSIQEKPGFWAVLPAAVRYDPELPPNAKLLYAEISALADRTGFCFATNAYFQELYGLSERTIQHLLSALKKGGHIRIEDGDGGSKQRKIYAGINPLSANPAKNCGVPPEKICGGPPKKIAGPPAENCGGNNKIQQDNDQSPHSPPGGAGEIWDHEAFEALWKLYPKKKDKAKAIKEWNRLKADRKLMRKMSAALKVQMESEEWQRDNGRAIPYLCRWLSHRRWEDEQEVTLPTVKRQEEVHRIWLN